MAERSLTMLLLLTTVGLLELGVVILAQDKCITPNNENGNCISVANCNPILEAIRSRNPAAFQFARESQCGFEGTRPLVCCGTFGIYTDITTRNEETSSETTTTTTARSTTTPVRQNFLTTPTPAETGTHYVNGTLQQTTTNAYLADRKVCGFQVATDRLLGGVKTDLAEFPWMVLMRYVFTSDNSDAGFRCAGTLVNKRYALTAAHCLVGNSIDGLTFMSVRLGEYDIRNKTDCPPFADYEDQNCADPVQDVGVEQIIPHPFYSPKSGNNDIAMIRLERDITFSEYIRPICLPPIDTPPPKVGVKMWVTGWGATENATLSPVKLKISVPIVENPICSTVLKAHRIRITANHVCAGGVEGVDACKGDSGGPLMALYSDTTTEGPQWYQEGVVSRGIGCGTSGYPGVYTRVSRYLQWILNNLTL